MEDFKNIPMVDLKSQYQNIKDQIDQSVISTIESSQFIGGSQVESFKISFLPCASDSMLQSGGVVSAKLDAKLYNVPVMCCQPSTPPETMLPNTLPNIGL